MGLLGPVRGAVHQASPDDVIEGNHENEEQKDKVTFAAYKARFAVPHAECGSPTSLYYSFDAAGVHFLMLAAYDDYRKASAQYAWAKADLALVDRAVTPWLVAVWHPPWYNSYSAHYREFECMRLEMEDLLYSHGVDVVFTGHVHAYERMNRVYNYTLDPCGPLHITIGDGGNREKMAIPHADEEGGCPTPEESAPESADVTGLNCAFNFTSGPAAGRFCWDRQPDWSAFRETSFGHGILEVKNATHALWTWYRNQDAFNDPRGDQIYIVRQPGVCHNQPK